MSQDALVRKEVGVMDVALVSGRIVNVPVVLQSKAAVEDPQVQFLTAAAHTSDTCPKTCPAVHCLRHSYILTAMPRACIESLWTLLYSLPSITWKFFYNEVPMAK